MVTMRATVLYLDVIPAMLYIDVSVGPWGSKG